MANGNLYCPSSSWLRKFKNCPLVGHGEKRKGRAESRCIKEQYVEDAMEGMEDVGFALRAKIIHKFLQLLPHSGVP